MAAKDEFKCKWKFVIAGLAVHGYEAETKMTPREQVEYQMKIVPYVDELLSKMYDSAVHLAEPPAVKPPPNPIPQVRKP